MTDTAKPTLWTLEDAAMAAFHGGSSSTWRQAFREIFSDNTLFLSSICKLMDDREDQKQKLLDERNQLLERVRELEAEQEELVQFFTELANDSVVFGLDTEFGDGFSVGVKTVCDAIKAALAKCGGGGCDGLRRSDTRTT